MDYLIAVGECLQRGNSGETRENVIKALEVGVSHQEILNHMLEVMEVVGRKFKKNELFVPEVLIIGRAFNVALEVISPLLAVEEKYLGTVVIGAVKGDLHDIGKNLVKMLMVGTGVRVIDLGVDVPAAKFVEAIKTYEPDIVAMSSLLTTTMIQVSKTIKEIQKAGLRDKVKIIIGGAPVTNNYAKNIGSDFYAIDAGTAAEIVREYIQKNS